MRQDETDDKIFYDNPRFVTHIDDAAIESLSKYYYHSIQPHSDVLDVCSSWISHLPDREMLPLGRVAGVGMNGDELKRNNRLTDFAVVDLNKNPSLPYDDQSFDVVLNAVSVDYLIQPQTIFQEIWRVLKPGGTAVMSFSNRCFPTKVIRLWLLTGDEEHTEIVARYFHHTNFVDIDAFDIASDTTSDPMFIVRATKPSNLLGSDPGDEQKLPHEPDQANL